MRLKFQLSINLVEFFVDDVGDDDSNDNSDDVDDILSRNLKLTHSSNFKWAELTVVGCCKILISE